MGQKEFWEHLYKKGNYKQTEPEVSVRNLVPLLEKRKVKKILDLGCGRGNNVVYLAKRKYFVVGSDQSSSALARAQNWLEEKGLRNFCLVEHDITDLPFPNEHFDAVISINVLHHNPLKKIRKTVSEIGRVLKKGGLLLTTIPSTKDYKFKIGKKLERNIYMMEDGVVHHFFDEKDAKVLFNEFKITEIKEIIEIKERKNLIHKEILQSSKAEKFKNIHWQILAEK